MIKRGFTALLFISFVVTTSAIAPSGYYNTTEGKKAAALKTALHDIICQDTTHYLGYGSGKGKTWEGFYYTDRNMTTNAVIDMYSDSVRYFPSPNPNFTAFGSAIEIEHSVPKSWWGCDITHPDCPARDLNHLFPADGTTNMSKNDNPLGVVTGTPTLSNGESKVGPGAYDGYVGNVFEPADQYKGDFARAYFYMATAYEHYINKWDTSKPENMMENNRYPVLKPWAIALLLQWHRQDPVSTKEVTRNDIVYGIQKNRNPFIDYPKLVEYIWGDRTTIPFRLDLNVNFPYLKWPSNYDTLKIGKIYCLHTRDTLINVQAMNLTGDLTLTLGGANATNFTLDKTTLTKAEAETGCTVGIHCSSSSAGNLSALLSVSGGGITPLVVILKATASDEFSALQPKTPPGNTNFVAEWTASPGATDYLLNVYTFQNTGATTPSTLIEEDFLLTLPNNWLKEGYTDNALSSNIRLASVSAYGKLTTPGLELSTATSTLTVRAKQYSNDTGAKLTATLNGTTVATWTTAVGNQDFLVDLPVAISSSKIALSAITGKRVYIDYMKLVANNPVYGPVSVSSFPKSVGNVLTYTVSGLRSGTSYSFTVTPQGNGATASNQITVQTALNTGTTSNQQTSWHQTTAPGGIRLINLQPGSTIRLLNLSGATVFVARTASANLFIPVVSHGFYLLQVQSGGISKILY
jgi:hypothetical protein